MLLSFIVLKYAQNIEKSSKYKKKMFQILNYWVENLNL